jgi:hypothetical protein
MLNGLELPHITGFDGGECELKITLQAHAYAEPLPTGVELQCRVLRLRHATPYLEQHSRDVPALLVVVVVLVFVVGEGFVGRVQFLQYYLGFLV